MEELSETQYLTLSVKDREYLKTLKTGVYKAHQLVFIKTFCVNSQDEHSLFKILKNEKVSLLKTLFLWLRVLRVENLVFLLTPIFSAFFLSAHFEFQNLYFLFLVMSSLSALYFSTLLFSDYFDFMKGKDRGLGMSFNSYYSFKPLYRLYGGVFFLFLAVGLSLLMWSVFSSRLIEVVFVTALLLVLFVTAKGPYGVILKSLIFFLCYGPLLFLGLKLVFSSSSENVDEFLYLGVFHGVFALNYFLNVNFKGLMFRARHLKNHFSQSFDFDNLKLFIQIVSFFLFLIPLIILFWKMEMLKNLSAQKVFGLSLWGFYYILLFQFFQTLKEVKSPLSLKSHDLVKKSFALYILFTMGLWASLF